MSGRASAPQLIFNDGVRNPDSSSAACSVKLLKNPRGSDDINDFYEVDRLCAEIKAIVDMRGTRSNGMFKVALQIPDECLGDTSELCWLFESRLAEQSSGGTVLYMVFCLGDTTNAPCCPDEIAAGHLQADCLVHFGHSCLSPCRSIPIMYSFGRRDVALGALEGAFLKAKSDVDPESHILLACEVQYSHSLHQVQSILGKYAKEVRLYQTISSTDPIGKEVLDAERGNCTAVFIGSDSSRPYQNLVLQLLSREVQPKNIWNWNPDIQVLSTSFSSDFQRRLARRFFLIQKAKSCTIFGVVVTNLSDARTRSVVGKLLPMLRDSDRTVYILAVGKITPEKIANFAEIECFVLVACPEHSLLNNDRDFPKPILTPLEACMSIVNLEWGSVPYSLDSASFLSYSSEILAHLGDDIDDTPYFSLVTGRFESQLGKSDDVERDLTGLPGQGKVTVFESAASKSLQNREFQGLQVQLGLSEVQTAVKGRNGIASEYS